MVNKLKRFLKSFGGMHARSSSNSTKKSSDPLETQQFVSGPYGSSSLAAFHASTSKSLSTSELEARLETSGSLAGTTTSNSTLFVSENGWYPLLAMIIKIIAECISSSDPSISTPVTKRGATDLTEKFADLVVLLQRMAGRENQQRLKQFYAGSDSENAPTKWNQRRKLFRQCRRTLLVCWKIVVAQLHDKKSSLPNEKRNLYFQLIGMIMERVEFHIPVTSSDTDKQTSAKIKTPKSSKNASSAGAGWLAFSPTTLSNGTILIEDSAYVGPNLMANVENVSKSSNQRNENFDDAMDSECDLNMYRCLLITTFKYASENLESARQKHRVYISLIETRFYARVFAVCFFRVPVLQSAMLKEIFSAYLKREWLSLQPHDSRVEDLAEEGIGRPTSQLGSHKYPKTSRPWNGVTFAGTLSRWKNYNGFILSEERRGNSIRAANARSRNKANKITGTSVSAIQTDEEIFIKHNPTLFQWTTFSPYLATYPDADIVRMTEVPRNFWLHRLKYDGEFFSNFMGFVCLHAANTALDADVVWTSLPGYTLLIRVSLLLIKEACWAKWLYVHDMSGPLPSSSMEIEPKSQDEDCIPFELESIRAIQTVLDNVVQLLRNNQLLESCVLAMYECTNVLHARSVEVCLTRFEEWFSATAMLTDFGGLDQRRGNGMMVYRLPPEFRGQTFAMGMRFMLSSENCEILSSTLLFLYHQMDYFEGELRKGILKALVHRHMSLFLHWNADVRTKYHHILVYRLVRVNRFVLDSPVDQLLIGHCAISTFEFSRAHDDEFDDDYVLSHRKHKEDSRFHDAVQHPSNLSMTTADISVLHTEQALWRAFDACLAVIIDQERRCAREGNRKFQTDQLAARSRALAFRTLKRHTTEDSIAAATTSINEGLPGRKPCHEVESLDEELRREPPYFLRYLPNDEEAMLEELRHLASNVKYPHENQVYAAPSLRCYSDLLKQYYRVLDSQGFVDPPPLAFF